jgi:hypothetical protein
MRPIPLAVLHLCLGPALAIAQVPLPQGPMAGSPGAVTGFDNAVQTMMQVFGANRCGGMKIHVRGARIPTAKDLEESVRRWEKRPGSKGLIPGDTVVGLGRDSQMSRLELQQAMIRSRFDLDRCYWDIYNVYGSIEACTLRALLSPPDYRPRTDNRQNSGAISFHGVATYWYNQEEVVFAGMIQPMPELDVLRKLIPWPGGKVDGRFIRLTLRRDQLPPAPELPADLDDWVAVGLAYLKNPFPSTERLGLGLLSELPPDDRCAEVGQALGDYVERNPALNLRHDAIKVLEHWGTAAQVPLLRRLLEEEQKVRASSLASSLRAAIRAAESRPATAAGRSTQPRGGARSAPNDLDAATPEQLAAALTSAAAAERDEILKRLEAGKGGAFTDALVDVLPNLQGETRVRARDALEQRLRRMTVKTLAAYLQEDNVDLKWAAIKAAGAKGSRELAPELINIVGSGAEALAEAAHDALEQITGQTLPRSAAPTPADWKRLAGQWRQIAR